MAAKRTPAEIQRDFDKVAPEIGTAIKALIRGYLPTELRDQEFSLTITTSIDKPSPKPALDLLAAKKPAVRKRPRSAAPGPEARRTEAR